MGTTTSSDNWIYHENLPDPDPRNSTIVWPKYPELKFNHENKEIQNSLDDIIFYIKYPDDYNKLPKSIPNLDKSLEYIVENHIQLPKFEEKDSIYKSFNNVNIEKSIFFMFKYGITHLFNIHIRDWFSVIDMFDKHGITNINAVKIVNIREPGVTRNHRGHRCLGDAGYVDIYPLLLLDSESEFVIGTYYWNYRQVKSLEASQFIKTCEKIKLKILPSIAEQIKSSQHFTQYLEKIKKRKTVEFLKKLKEESVPQPPIIPTAPLIETPPI